MIVKSIKIQNNIFILKFEIKIVSILYNQNLQIYNYKKQNRKFLSIFTFLQNQITENQNQQLKSVQFIGAIHRGQITQFKQYNYKYLFISSADSTISVFNIQKQKVMSQRIYDQNLSGINCIEIYNQLLIVGCDEKLIIFKILKLDDNDLQYQIIKLQMFQNSMITSITFCQPYIFITTDTAMIYVLSSADLSVVTQNFSHQNMIILSYIIQYNRKQILMTFDINKRLHFHDVEDLELEFTCTLPDLASSFCYDEQTQLLYINTTDMMQVYKLCQNKISYVKSIRIPSRQNIISQTVMHNNKLYYYYLNYIYQLDIQTEQSILICTIPKEQIVTQVLLLDNILVVGTNYGIVFTLQL